MEYMVRRVIICGSCGGPITQYDYVCPYCSNVLEPSENSKHVLPHVTYNSYSATDSAAIKPHLDYLGEFNTLCPVGIDELTNSVWPLKDHRYPYREYIIDLLSLIARFRSICGKGSAETREVHLEIYKRLDAIYNSLTGNSVY